MIPGSNILNMALGAIGSSPVRLKKFLAETVDAQGTVINSYEPPVLIPKGSVQAVNRARYEQFGLDFEKNYISWYVSEDVSDLAPLPDFAPGITYLSARGTKIYERSGEGNEVVFHGFNWYGFGGPLMAPGMLSVMPWRTVTLANGTTVNGVLDLIAATGVNFIRIPICQDVCWNRNSVDDPQWGFVSASLNPDFVIDGAPEQAYGNSLKSALDILDIVVAYCGELGIRVMIDMHCLSPNNDNNASTTGKWYSTTNPDDPGDDSTTVGALRNEAQWLNAWSTIAAHYAGNPIVCAFDLINEPFNTFWNDDPATGLPAALERCAAAIQAVNSDALIVCQSIQGHGGTFKTGPDIGPAEAVTWYTAYSGDFSGVRTRPVTIQFQNKIVYSPHEYGIVGGGQYQWFEEPTYTDYPDILNNNIWPNGWGFLIDEGIAPVLIGEYGVTTQAATPTLQAQENNWMTRLIAYVGARGMSHAYWSANAAQPGNESAGEGLINSDYATLNTAVVNFALNPMTASYTPNANLPPDYLSLISNGDLVEWPVARDGSTIIGKTRRYRVVGSTDWLNIDGWKEILAVDLGIALRE